MKIDIERLINMNYIKYNRMSEIIQQAFVNSNASFLNVYIDLHSIFNSFYKNDIEIVDYMVVTSSIINMCAHYRNFFLTRYNVYTYFYLIYSDNCHYVNKQFCPEYNKGVEYTLSNNKLIYEMINQNLKLLNIICPYIKDVFFIKGTFETGVIIHDIIMRNKAKHPERANMILSKDRFNYQLVENENTILVRPKKTKLGDESYYITNSNLLSIYLKERKVKYRPSININAGLYTFILSLSSFKERNIKSIFNISKILKLIEKSISNYKIINGYNFSLDKAFDSLTNIDENIPNVISYESFLFRFKAIDIPFLYSIFMTTPECKSMVFKNLYDPETLNKINNKYFSRYPLDLNRL